ncbi:hypothetical protein O9H32_30160 [Paenibacillus mucilaginosus]|nr:hypothetical protein [Paenibacillus caseinilyticus]
MRKRLSVKTIHEALLLSECFGGGGGIDRLLRNPTLGFGEQGTNEM